MNPKRQLERAHDDGALRQKEILADSFAMDGWESACRCVTNSWRPSANTKAGVQRRWKRMTSSRWPSTNELKHQLGWLGFTTHDHARSEMMTLFVALVYNWWSLFTRLSVPNIRVEATSAHPLMLLAIGRETSHSNQSTLTVTSLHAEATKAQASVKAVAVHPVNRGTVEACRVLAPDPAGRCTSVLSRPGDGALWRLSEGTTETTQLPFIGS